VATASKTAERLLEALVVPFTIGPREVSVGASIGIAIGSVESETDELIRNADVAMYSAKAKGKARYEVFRQQMRDAVVERMDLETDLRKAMDRDELRVVYQPIVELDGGRLAGVEALVRWNHPRRGFLAPSQFIPLAEETGIIAHLGRHVLAQACRDARVWLDQGASISLSVNLSVKQFQDPALPLLIKDELERSGLPSESLVLEITESVMMEEAERVLEKLRDLRALGVRIGIDDFGTGYSSLSYLQRLPLDVLKIDKAFVDGITRGAEDSAVARAIIRLAETLKLKTTAEGIETAAQAAKLAALGCDFGQGYYFSRPMPADAIGRLVRETMMPAVLPRRGREAETPFNRVTSSAPLAARAR
jgi:EAL domain-containing protein (putative c-di-GMP-specific phosphodiesterase class I)